MTFSANFFPPTFEKLRLTTDRAIEPVKTRIWVYFGSIQAYPVPTQKTPQTVELQAFNMEPAIRVELMTY